MQRYMRKEFYLHCSYKYIHIIIVICDKLLYYIAEIAAVNQISDTTRNAFPTLLYYIHYTGYHGERVKG
jgi:hypothetical protein